MRSRPQRARAYRRVGFTSFTRTRSQERKCKVTCSTRSINSRKNYLAFGFAIFFGLANADIDLRFSTEMIVSGNIDNIVYVVYIIYGGKQSLL